MKNKNGLEDGLIAGQNASTPKYGVLPGNVLLTAKSRHNVMMRILPLRPIDSEANEHIDMGRSKSDYKLNIIK
ncbi:MAG TPA: hypothetical protein DHW15_11670 [Bacteroidetes bacterium]|jgi:hypothetical protein|nr:MAG: hypothetical protein ABR95_06655 [Sphingobacteriales bacterium BACL12 MAG-120813-bin55]HCK22782.1 hypothetical protein [Bacteroidota bacterium]